MTPKVSPEVLPGVLPKVSVVIPAFNAARFLPQAVESVLAQTLQDFEVVIVNDGSTDHTERWLEQPRDPRVRFINQHNQGAATARNRGIAATGGPYVALLDADDLWEPTKLEQQVAVLDARPDVGLVHTAVRYVDERGADLGRVLRSQLRDGGVWNELVVNRGVRCGSTPMIRRRCFDAVGVFDPSLTFDEDWDVYLRIAARYAFATLDEPLVRYRQHGTNTSKNYRTIMPNSLRVLERAFRTAPPGRARLKRAAYGHAYLFAAWYAFGAGDVRQAAALHRQAFREFPGLVYKKNSLHLSLRLAQARLSGRGAAKGS